MIPAAVITGWSQAHPWSTSAQVEQDLVLSRALVEIYQDPLLADALVFRGGTALHKLLLAPAARYSEDLDFVQRESAPVGAILDRLQQRLNPWLGEPRRNVSPGCPARERSLGPGRCQEHGGTPRSEGRPLGFEGGLCQGPQTLQSVFLS
ncbi:MAG: nucleotidyl transferase AbiEii/AbiGii toxin family protein [Opitutales bacterium]